LIAIAIGLKVTGIKKGEKMMEQVKKKLTPSEVFQKIKSTLEGFSFHVECTRGCAKGRDDEIEQAERQLPYMQATEEFLEALLEAAEGVKTYEKKMRKLLSNVEKKRKMREKEWEKGKSWFPIEWDYPKDRYNQLRELDLVKPITK